MIPAVIHCFWAQGRRTPLAERCLASWRTLAPGWEIREWTLADFPTLPRFCADAVRRRQWAFVSDWVRFEALHREGGVYFDLDLELIRPIDGLPSGEWVAGEWTARGGTAMNPGAGIALEKQSPIAKAMLDHYSSAEPGDRTTVGEILGALDAAKTLRTLDPETLSPIGVDGRLHRSERTIGIHRYAMSWASPKQRILRWMSWHGMRPLIDAALRVKWAMRGGPA